MHRYLIFSKAVYFNNNIKYKTQHYLMYTLERVLLSLDENTFDSAHRHVIDIHSVAVKRGGDEGDRSPPHELFSIFITIYN